MCVIIAKPSATAAPKLDTIRAAIQTNPDGFALVWVKDGHLVTFRTMNADAMTTYYAEHLRELNTAPFVFHARIATDGSKNIKNCHGWPTLNGHAAFFHNGVLPLKNRDDMTDSETFLRDIYEPIALKAGHKKATKAIRAIIGTSKFAFIGDNGEIKLYGHYIDRGGVKFSNLNHEWRENIYTGRLPFYGYGGCYVNRDNVKHGARHYSYIDRLQSLTDTFDGVDAYEDLP